VCGDHVEYRFLIETNRFHWRGEDDCGGLALPCPRPRFVFEGANELKELPIFPLIAAMYGLSNIAQKRGQS
jgi:hypothetical protein